MTYRRRVSRRFLFPGVTLASNRESAAMPQSPVQYATAKGLREQRHKLVQQARKDILEKAEAEGRDFTAEENAAWQKIMGGTAPDGTKVQGEVDVLAERIARLERVDALDQEFSSPANPGNARVGRGDYNGQTLLNGSRLLPTEGATPAHTEEIRAMALQAWCRAQFGEDLSEDHEEACRAVGLNPNRPKLHIQLYRTEDCQRLQRRFRGVHHTGAVDHCQDFRANMSGVTGSTGAYLIPPESLIRQLEVNMLAFGGMRQVSEILRTASGERMSWPTASDTSNTGEQLGEGASVGSSVDPTIGKVFWDAYKFSSKLIRVPYELLEDSAFNLVVVLGNMLGERIGRITNTKYTTGSGSGTARGIVPAAGTVTPGSATALTFDDIIKLEHAVDPAYRVGASFMCHDAIIEYLRKLKDGQGRYLWQENQQVGAADRFHGLPFTINQDMDSTIASGKKTLLFGQLSKYKIRSVNGIRMYRLQERFRDNDEDGFIAFVREDGNLLDAGTDPVKVLAH